MKSTNHIVLSSRIRLARNLEGFPFGPRLFQEKAEEIVKKVGSLLEKNGFEKVDLRDISSMEAASYVERHLASPEFAAAKHPRALMINKPCGLSVMVCEEDHLRIQAILPDLSLTEAYKNACSIDECIEKELPIAYDETLGYLTHCPTNLGTGMRASVMMFLPALTIAGRIDHMARRLAKVGVAVRGLFGEGTASEGNLYQISGQVTLGITEEDSIRKLSEVVSNIEKEELDLRALITKEKNPKLVDRICRSEGILRHAFLLSSSEFLSLYSDVRLGLDLGLVCDISHEALDTLLSDVMPATLALHAKIRPQTETERDILRADRIKEVLSAQ